MARPRARCTAGTAAVAFGRGGQRRIASLYVNSYKYRRAGGVRPGRLGFREVGTFATVLLD